MEVTIYDRKQSPFSLNSSDSSLLSSSCWYLHRPHIYIWDFLCNIKKIVRVNFKKKRLFSIEKLNVFQDIFLVFIKIFGVKAWCIKANIFVKVNSNWAFSLGFLGHIFYLFEQLWFGMHDSLLLYYYSSTLLKSNILFL